MTIWQEDTTAGVCAVCLSKCRVHDALRARITDLEQQLLAAQADAVAVREALTPFALLGASLPPSVDDADEFDITVRAGEVRKARAALSTPTPGTAILAVLARARKVIAERKDCQKWIDMNDVHRWTLDELADALAALPGGTDGGKQSE